MGVRDIYILSNTPIKGAKQLPIIKQRYFPPPHNLLEYDYLIFTSKNGVKAIDYYTDEWKKIPALTIGKSTAKMVEKLGGKIAYVAQSFYSEDFIKEIIQNFNSKKNRFLYLRAKKVGNDFVKITKKLDIELHEAIVYETQCRACEHLERPSRGSIIIFSSPSTIRCFFNCFNWDASYHAVAIGKKTAQFLPKNMAYKLFEQLSLQEIVDNLQGF